MQLKLIKGGNIHDGLGHVLKGADILIEGAVIKSVGQSITPAAGYELIDAEGKEVFPGFIDPCNVWGAAGPELRDNDMHEHIDPVSPDLNVIYAFDHEGMLFQKAFEYGVSAMGLMPSFANVLGGRAAVYKTYGKHPYKMIIKDQAAMAGSFSNQVISIYGKNKKAPQTRMGMASLLDTALAKAKRHTGAMDYDPKSEALQPVLSGKMPLFICTPRGEDMDAVDLLMEKYPEINIVYINALDTDKNRQNILAGKNGAILGDSVGIDKIEMVKFSDIGEMVKSGAKIALGTCANTGGARESILWNAILYHKHGVEEEDVIKMITSIPAELLGVSHRIGAIEPGKDADISIWSHNPVQTYRARIETMLISGENVLDKEVITQCW